jgi:hypothetical protein
MKIKYAATRIPLNMFSVSMRNLKINNKAFDKMYDLPPPNFKNATAYELNKDKFKMISVENPQEATSFMDFERPLPCKKEGVIFLKSLN